MNSAVSRVLMLVCIATLAGSHLSGTQSSAASLSREQVLDGWANALGGRAKLQSVYAVHLAGTVETGGLKGTYERWSTSRGEYRISIEIPNAFRQTRIFDGRQAWVHDMSGAVHQVSGGDLQTVITSAYEASASFLLPDRMTGHVEMVGEDETRQAYVMRLLPDGGTPLTVYLDRKTFLPQSEESSSAMGRRVISFSNWRDAAGTKFPGSVLQSGSDPRFDTQIITSLFEVDPPIPADLFTKPDETAPSAGFADGRNEAGFTAVLYAKHVFIPVRVNGGEPGWFFVDSGAAESVISKSWAEKIGLTFSGTIGGQGTGSGTSGMGVASKVVFDLPGVRISTNTVAVWDFSHLLPVLGRPWDGIIGYDVLSRLVVRIDYERKQVTLFDPKTFSPDARAVSLPITFMGNLPVVHAKVMVPGRDAMDVRCAIDSGAGGFHLTAPFIRKNHILESLPRITATATVGVGGQSKEYVGRITGLQLGPFLLRDPVAEFSSNDKAGLLATEEIDALIGGDILQRFTMTFDFPHHRILMEPNGNFSRPFPADASGLSLLAKGDDFHRFEVKGVQPGSAAAAAGLHTRDVLTTIDGRPASDFNLETLGTLFEQSGRTLPITIERNGKQRRLRIRLRARF